MQADSCKPSKTIRNQPRPGKPSPPRRIHKSRCRLLASRRLLTASLRGRAASLPRQCGDAQPPSRVIAGTRSLPPASMRGRAAFLPRQCEADGVSRGNLSVARLGLASCFTATHLSCHSPPMKSARESVPRRYGNCVVLRSTPPFVSLRAAKRRGNPSIAGMVFVPFCGKVSLIERHRLPA